MSPENEPDQPRVTVRNKRRLDPETGEVKAPEAPQEPAAADVPPPAGDPAADQAADQAPDPGPDPVQELTETLQRVQAEYSNYRKRVERDRLAMVEQATGALLQQLLPLLDDVARARQHDDLTGAFKVVGEGLEQVAAKLGLETYGTPGEPFDPQVHEAVMQAAPDPAFSVATCAQVFRPGFRVGGRVLRPAQVAVAEPGEPAAGSADGPAEQTAEQ